MTITPEAVIQVIELGVLTGIFYRMGRFGAEISAHDGRIDKLESKL
ncbi:hypothetical protein WG622_02535 [Cognatishimia sp. D5M38]|uniref:Uncharacterized protein n=1 Tax=Cognatishimia coralii TaxID=3083254 RepID=A0ABU8QCF6_9RHOB